MTLKFVAILPHDAGFFQADEVVIVGETKDELRDAAQRACIGGRYVSSIVAIVNDKPVTVYRESSGWALENPTDTTKLAYLVDS